MKADYINPFVTSTVAIMKEMLGLNNSDIKRGKLALKTSTLPTLGVASVIGLTGDIKGRVILDISKETAVKIAEKMNNEKLPGLNGLVRSSINELNNIISGRAVTILKNNGFNFDVTPPTLFSGEGMEINDQSGLQTLVIPIDTPYGRVVVNVAIK